DSPRHPKRKPQPRTSTTFAKAASKDVDCRNRSGNDEKSQHFGYLALNDGKLGPSSHCRACHGNPRRQAAQCTAWITQHSPGEGQSSDDDTKPLEWPPGRDDETQQRDDYF